MTWEDGYMAGKEDAGHDYIEELTRLRALNESLFDGRELMGKLWAKEKEGRDALHAKLEKAKQALRPFAERGQKLAADTLMRDDDVFVVSVGDCRNAASIYKEISDE